jgi:hypothetical protein
MKPRNFPARKLARQLAAKNRCSCRGLREYGLSYWGVLMLEGQGVVNALDNARAVRTKKARGSK